MKYLKQQKEIRKYIKKYGMSDYQKLLNSSVWIFLILSFLVIFVAPLLGFNEYLPFVLVFILMELICAIAWRRDVLREMRLDKQWEELKEEAEGKATS